MDDDGTFVENLHEDNSLAGEASYRSRTQSRQKAPVKQTFEEYTTKPFSFAAGDCDEITEEQMFRDFKEWITRQNENFLYTFEPRPTTTHLTLGKCPHMHTELTWEERLQAQRQVEQQERMRKEIEQFLRKRLRLIKRLLSVYRKAKMGIEKEYRKDLSRKDPYCVIKRKQATKRIVDMMIKQFALEYLYLKSIKIKNEIDEINCILIDTNRTRHLKNIHKYTIRTAEKLRCILELECGDEPDEIENFFEEKTLRNMARMYLTELETLAQSSDLFEPRDWSSERFWDETMEMEETPISEFEPLRDIFRDTDDFQGSVSDEQSVTDLQEPEDRKSEVQYQTFTVSEKQTVGEAKTSEEEDDKSERRSNDVFNAEDSFKEILRAEESQNIIEEIKREILTPDYYLEGEITEKKEEKEETAPEDAAELEENRAEVEMLQEFKREIWLIEAFHFYTTKLRPELAGKFKLTHSKSIYDADFDYDDESTWIDLGSSVASDLDQCLVYLNRYRSSKIISYEPFKQRDSVSPDKSSLSLQSSEKVSRDEDSTHTGDSSYIYHDDAWKKDSEASFGDESVESPKQLLGTVEEEDINLGESGSGKDFGTPIYKFETKSDIINSDDVVTGEIERDGKEYAKESADSSAGSRVPSIPSFCGSLHDPLKKYRKCADQRQHGQYSDVNLLKSLDDFMDDDEDLPMSMSDIKLDDNASVKSRTSVVSIYHQNLEDSEPESSQQESKEESSEKSVLSVRSRCLPKLMDVMKYFTAKIKGITKSEEESEDEEMVEEEEVIYETPMEWEEIMGIKWERTEEKVQSTEPLQCDLDTTELMEQLGRLNKQYMMNHPEMKVLIILILRQLSMKRPEAGFTKFIRDTVHNKQFAKQLSSYLSVHNKGYRRRKGVKEAEDCRQALDPEQTTSMFSFDKPSSEYWREWGVDYEKVVKKLEGTTEPQSGEVSWDSVRNSTEETRTDRASWDFTEIFENIRELKEQKAKAEDQDMGWTRFSAHLMRHDARSLRKEAACINALVETLQWDPPPDLRSTCQQSNPPIKIKHKRR